MNNITHKFLAITLILTPTFFLSCKKIDQESRNNSLSQKLSLEKDVKYLNQGECLVEFKQNFAKGKIEVQNIDHNGSSLCMDTENPKFAIRARLDIDEVRDPGPLAISIVVDSSGSLRTTDPLRKKDGALIQFLNQLGKGYASKMANLKVKVIFTGFCELDSYTRTFSGSSQSDYQGFVNSISFPPARYQTNFIHALQSSNEFLEPLGKLGFSKNIVLFSDGMPWSKGVKEPGLCPSVIATMEADLRRDSRTDLSINLEECSGLSGFTKDSGRCSEVIPRNGLSSEGLLPELDPINVVLAMAKHVDFAKKHFVPNAVVFHSVFLSSGTCWEEANSTGPFKNEFRYLCNEVARNQLFTKMSGGTGKNILINNADHLEGAFSSLYRGLLKQHEISEIEFQTAKKTTTGVVCNQVGGEANCPLGDKVISGTSFGSSGEAGYFNVHIPVAAYGLSESGQLNATLKETGEKVSFGINVKLGADRSSCESFKEGTSFIKDGAKHQVLTLETDTLRVSCKKVKFLGCVNEFGKTVKDGEMVGTKSCLNYPKCGEATTVNQFCKDGTLIPKVLECPAETKSIEECKPEVCSPTEVVPIAGKEDQIYKVSTGSSPSSCSSNPSFICSKFGWQKMDLDPSSCEFTCSPGNGVSSYGSEDQIQVVSGFSKSYSTNCLAEKISIESVCKSGNWVKLNSAMDIHSTCKEVEESCTVPESCSGKVYGSDDPYITGGGANVPSPKSSTVFGKRL